MGVLTCIKNHAYHIPIHPTCKINGRWPSTFMLGDLYTIKHVYASSLSHNKVYKFYIHSTYTLKYIYKPMHIIMRKKIERGRETLTIKAIPYSGIVHAYWQLQSHQLTWSLWISISTDDDIAIDTCQEGQLQFWDSKNKR